jgi:hypothetical protein
MQLESYRSTTGPLVGAQRILDPTFDEMTNAV